VESARKVLDPTMPSNELMRRSAPSRDRWPSRRRSLWPLSSTVRSGGVRGRWSSPSP